jgi:predicted nucleic-acid-binding protein
MASRKRYNLVIPETLYSAIDHIAEEQDSSFVEVVKSFLRFALALYQVQKSENAKILIEVEGRQKEIHWMV